MLSPRKPLMGTDADELLTAKHVKAARCRSEAQHDVVPRQIGFDGGVCSIHLNTTVPFHQSRIPALSSARSQRSGSTVAGNAGRKRRNRVGDLRRLIATTEPLMRSFLVVMLLKERLL